MPRIEHNGYILRDSPLIEFSTCVNIIKDTLPHHQGWDHVKSKSLFFDQKYGQLNMLFLFFILQIWPFILHGGGGGGATVIE